MTSRERNLALILVALLVIVGGGLLGKIFLLDPYLAIQNQKAQRANEIQDNRNKIDAEKKYIARVKEVSPRLGEWRKFSLPEPKESTAEAQKAHISKLRIDYQKEV